MYLTFVNMASQSLQTQRLGVGRPVRGWAVGLFIFEQVMNLAVEINFRRFNANRSANQRNVPQPFAASINYRNLFVSGHLFLSTAQPSRELDQLWKRGRLLIR